MGIYGRACLVGAAALLGWAAPSTAAPPVSAVDPACPDVEAVFARGTAEEPGVGPVGQAFIDALRAKVGEKSMVVYAVSYPATDDWPTGIEGIRDASTHIQSVVAACPKAKVVLGGYSQGAAVAGFTTADTVPEGVDGVDVPRPMPPEVADHIAALVLFGKPNNRAMSFLGQPPVAIGPLYEAKTIELCVPEDAVCSEGLDFSAHNPDTYGALVDEGARYAASRL